MNKLRFKKCLGIIWWMTWRIVVLASFIMLINKACIGVQCSKPIVTPTDSVNVATTLQDSVYGAKMKPLTNLTRRTELTWKTLCETTLAVYATQT